MAIIMRGDAQFSGTPNRSACWLIPWAYGEMFHILQENHETTYARQAFFG